MDELGSLSEWEASRAHLYRKRVKPIPEGAGELTPDILASMSKHFKRWKPDRWWTWEGHQQKERTKGRKPVVLDNYDLVLLFEGLDYYDSSSPVPSLVDDILHGVTRLDMSGNTRPMSKTILFTLLSKVDKLSTDAIASVLSVGTRQAQRYMTMCGIAQDFIRREVVKRGIYNYELIAESDRTKIVDMEEDKINDVED